MSNDLVTQRELALLTEIASLKTKLSIKTLGAGAAYAAKSEQLRSDLNALNERLGLPIAPLSQPVPIDPSQWTPGQLKAQHMIDVLEALQETAGQIAFEIHKAIDMGNGSADPLESVNLRPLKARARDMTRAFVELNWQLDGDGAVGA